MIIFVFVSVGLLLGEYLAWRGSEHRRDIVLGAIAGSAVLGAAAWLGGLDGDVVLSIADSTTRPLPSGVSAVLLAALVVLYLALLVCGAVIAATLTVIAVAAAVHRARHAAPHPALPAAETYAGAVAPAVHELTGTQVDAVVTDEHANHPAALWIDLTAPGIDARWTAGNGWSARTPSGRRWYSHRHAPSPGAIALWLVEIGQRPRLGSREIPSFDNTADLTIELLATIPPPRHGADMARDLREGPA
ncbi:hypothetical protein ACIRG5_19230 [Lentzea sp. NPDC102401]|uniref:hypothetical protein n=1 Tax=Lentzea sp. NPDC102401 TaxID=3364128 RepID=UPI003820A048